MMRILRITLLSAAICLLGITAALAYNEAPMLKALVDAGELLPVEKRLPEEPRVIEPLDEIGEYGGLLRCFDKTALGWTVASLKEERLFKLAPDVETIVPNVVTGYEFSKDYKSCKLFLRKGMKWSDGYPLTADDFVFFYEDVLLNKDLYPTLPTWTRPGGETFKVSKIDEYTVLYTFAAPYPTFIYKLMGDEGLPIFWGSYLPEHYFKQLHIKYNPKANELAKEKGFEKWQELFIEVANTRHSFHALGTPTIEPWVWKKMSIENATLERNPYYWQVDTAGNQLPYIDKIYAEGISDPEIRTMKIISGESDLATRLISLSDYPLFKENEGKGEYKTRLWKSTAGAEHTFVVNRNYKDDPMLGKIFSDVRFEKALSLAIDRDEINEILYLGLAVPRQATVLPQCRYFEPEFATAYAEYNPDQANKFLDEMGLTERNKDGFRLMPDGRVLSLRIQFDLGTPEKSTLCELAKAYWEKVGIKVLLKSESTQLTQASLQANTVHVTTLTFSEGTDISFTLRPRNFVPMREHCPWGQLWYLWEVTDGKSGEEPPATIKRVIRDAEIMLTATSEEERTKAGKNILRTQAENLWGIGTVGMAPSVVIVKNRLHNVPEEGYAGYTVFFGLIYEPAQYFIKE